MWSLGGYLVPVGTVLVTPDLRSHAIAKFKVFFYLKEIDHSSTKLCIMHHWLYFNHNPKAMIIILLLLLLKVLYLQ